MWEKLTSFFRNHSPHINIWNVSFVSNKTGECFHNVYFLFYGPAFKYFYKKSKENQEVWTVSLGGECVFFW